MPSLERPFWVLEWGQNSGRISNQRKSLITLGLFNFWTNKVTIVSTNFNGNKWAWPNLHFYAALAKLYGKHAYINRIWHHLNMVLMSANDIENFSIQLSLLASFSQWFHESRNSKYLFKSMNGRFFLLCQNCWTHLHANLIIVPNLPWNEEIVMRFHFAMCFSGNQFWYQIYIQRVSIQLAFFWRCLAAKKCKLNWDSLYLKHHRDNFQTIN